ncbi:hypothetical protein OQA88_11131 [Cercophora sp. LCS_1]
MPPLCERCQSFDIHTFRHSVTAPWRGYRARDVRKSAENGCPFCTHLANAFPAAFGPKKESRVGEYSIGNWVHFRVTRADDMVLAPGSETDAPSAAGLGISYLKATIAANPRQLVGTDIKDPDNFGVAIQYRVLADANDAATTSRDVLGRYIYDGIRRTNTEVLVSSVKAWLDACLEHGECSRTLSGQHVDQRNTELPTRCVYVWKDQGGVKFCLQDTTGKKGVYITVSHRWLADEDMNTTTRSNLGSRLTCESFHPLPPLFLDVITLASHLGISYVWIDSLCIVQGGGGEWDVEAEKMASYYQNSMLTVACTSASKTLGLFNNTPPVEGNGPPLIQLPYLDQSGDQQGHLYLCPDLGEEEKDYWDNIANSELLSRGWVFQEWALSRRIICCTTSDIFFRCKTSPLRTASGIIHPRKQWNHMPDFMLREMFSRFHQLFEGELSFAWRTIVEAYSALKLTRPEQDRLVALSGVADEFGRAFARQDTEAEEERSIYVAGLWMPVILDGLLWEKVGEEPHDRLVTIPSYSWASVYGPVRWSTSAHLKHGGAEDDCEVVNILLPPHDNIHSIDSPSFTNGPLEYRPPRDPANTNRNRFPVLCLQTKLQPVFLGGRFPTQEDRDLAARITQQAPKSGGARWRQVASHLDREHVAGWASLEHPDFQNALDPGSPPQVIFALQIARRFDASPGLGYVWGIYSVFNVLFVRRVEAVVNGFERVGVGALFGKEIERQFETAVAREIRLL